MKLYPLSAVCFFPVEFGCLVRLNSIRQLSETWSTLGSPAVSLYSGLLALLASLARLLELRKFSFYLECVVYGNPRAMRMMIMGQELLPTAHEADWPDLPGSVWTATTTNGVVTEGTVSTGHLTAGLDRDHGLTGDYWYLDTQPGHDYRVEVKFGDNPDVSTGGAAGTDFYDRGEDHDFVSSCCESDNNREDGATFFHFTHAEKESDTDYMADVTAYDQLYSRRDLSGHDHQPQPSGPGGRRPPGAPGTAQEIHRRHPDNTRERRRPLQDLTAPWQPPGGEIRARHPTASRYPG